MAVRNIEREIEELKKLRCVDGDDVRIPALRKALNDKVNVIVAAAAKLIAQLEFQALVPDLCGSFERLLKEPLKSDPKCWGKIAITQALKTLGHNDPAIYLKGVNHVQMEPVWGGEEDTATTVRATCALALLDCFDVKREDKFWHLQRLLTDRAASLRKEAAQALEFLGGPEAALLLRIKARMGDEDSTVLGQVFETLLRVEGDSAAPFIVEFLRAPNPDTREEAALALGASRLDAAVAALKNELAGKHSLPGTEVVFRALAISRHQDAMALLLETLKEKRLGEAIGALAGLALFRDSAEMGIKILEAVSTRSEPEIRIEYEKLFGEK